MRRMRTFIILFMLLNYSIFVSLVYSQKVKTVNGARIVHNEKAAWGNNPKVKPVLSGKLGELDSENENYMFYMPSGIAEDSKGNLYVIDRGNYRVQKYDKSGKYLATLGGKGQGPGEFTLPVGIAVDNNDNIYVADHGSLRLEVFSPDGKSLKSHKLDDGVAELVISRADEILMGNYTGFLTTGPGEGGFSKEPKRLLRVLDLNGRMKTQVGEPFNYNNYMLNREGNKLFAALDKKNNIYIALKAQNRIDKYSRDGKLLLRIDRPVNFELSYADGKMEQQGRSMAYRAPNMKPVSTGIAVDREGRIWVAAARRELKKEERVDVNINWNESNGETTFTTRLFGATDITKTDMYELQLFSKEGILLARYPLTHFCDGLYILGGRIYIMDKFRGMQFYIYTITQKT